MGDSLYMAGLANGAAIEIDNYILGRGEGFDSVRKLRDKLEKSNFGDWRDAFSNPFYFRVVSALRNVGVAPKDYRELNLRVKLFCGDLRDVETRNRERLGEMRSFLVKLSEKCLVESDSSLRFLAA